MNIKININMKYSKSRNLFGYQVFNYNIQTIRGGVMSKNGGNTEMTADRG